MGLQSEHLARVNPDVKRPEEKKLEKKFEEMKLERPQPRPDAVP
jgi:hypothetical protein